MARASRARTHRTGVNIRLRPFGAADAVWCDGWLPAVAASVGYDASSCGALLRRSRAERGMRLRTIERDGNPVGLLVYQLHTPFERNAVIEFVGAPPKHARAGSAMAAAALVERELHRAKVTRIYAPAPAIHGIDVYFWIRLGYHPLLRPEWPCERAGLAWMVRQIAGSVTEAGEHDRQRAHGDSRSPAARSNPSSGRRPRRASSPHRRGRRPGSTA